MFHFYDKTHFHISTISSLRERRVAFIQLFRYLRTNSIPLSFHLRFSVLPSTSSIVTTNDVGNRVSLNNQPSGWSHTFFTYQLGLTSRIPYDMARVSAQHTIRKIKTSFLESRNINTYFYESEDTNLCSKRVQVMPSEIQILTVYPYRVV